MPRPGRPLLAALWLCGGPPAGSGGGLWRAAGEQALRKVSFSNFRTKTLALRWDDGTDDGFGIGEIPAMGTFTVEQTYVGHKFKLVEEDAEGTVEVVSRFVMRQGKQTYVVEPLEEDRQNEAYLRSMEQNSMVEALNMLHTSGKLRAVRFQSQARPVNVRPAFGMVIKNFRRDPCDVFWDDGSPDGVFSGNIQAMGTTSSMTTYPGDAFKVICKDELVTRFVMDPKQRRYVVEPLPTDESALGSPEYAMHQREAKLEEEYTAMSGIPWLGAHPPDPPSNPMYAAGSSIGQAVHTVNARGLNETRDLLALSWNPVGPRAFLIENLLTPEECTHVIEVSKDKLHASYIGVTEDSSQGFESKTRTSKMTFIPRSTTKELEAMHLKFADILNVSDEVLHRSAEELQVVRYEQGQEYAPHYDFTREKGLDRLATLLIYLGDGGGTVFPRAFDDRGLTVHPKQGDAILFYSMLPDGNLDELSLHGGMPVAAGTKWVCNLWLHSHGDRPWNGGHELQKAEL